MKNRLAERIVSDFAHLQITARIPGGKWGTPKDLAGITLFLASEASNYVTGTIIPVDGGYIVR